LCISDGQQYHQYQQNKESVSSAGQQFYHYQQHKESVNSDDQQFQREYMCMTYLNNNSLGSFLFIVASSSQIEILDT
jgi:hypothetical protein